MKQITFITGNERKLTEARNILTEFEVVNKQIDLPEIQSADPKEVVEAKLKEAYELHEGEYMVEDTSLSLNALNGLPGPLIKWFLDGIGADGVGDLASKYEDQSGYATCMVGYIDESGTVHYFEGRVDGKIVLPRGDTRFGWDPIFEPSGSNQTFAEMTPEEKNSISHRRLALEKFAEFLSN